MAMIQSQRNCKTCGRKTLHAQSRLGLGWGLLLMLLTGGLFVLLWIPIWIYQALSGWRCQACGGHKMV